MWFFYVLKMNHGPIYSHNIKVREHPLEIRVFNLCGSFVLFYLSRQTEA